MLFEQSSFVNNECRESWVNTASSPLNVSVGSTALMSAVIVAVPSGTHSEPRTSELKFPSPDVTTVSEITTARAWLHSVAKATTLTTAPTENILFLGSAALE